MIGAEPFVIAGEQFLTILDVPVPPASKCGGVDRPDGECDGQRRNDQLFHFHFSIGQECNRATRP